MGLLIAQAGAGRAAPTVTVAEPRADAPRAGAARSAPARSTPIRRARDPTVVMLATGAPDGLGARARSAPTRGARDPAASRPPAPGERRAFDVDELFFKELEIQATYSAGPRDTRAALELIAARRRSPPSG